MAKAKKKNNTKEPIEKQLWKAADKLRKNIDAAEYKHIVLGLIFLKYISDAFEELFERLKKGEDDYAGADPEDKDEYKAENVFFVPESARWSYLQSKARLPDIGKVVDEAMDAIEKDNSSLRDVLPKVYARGQLDPANLGEFALAEGKKGGQFYTPRSVVELLVEMLEPNKGRVFDPCCGSSGMFVQSEKFVAEHQGRLNDISIYGQESNHTTWRLARMNLAIRGIDSSQVKWNNEDSFLNDSHKDLKADFVIANPPFNDSDWSGDLIRKEFSIEDISTIAGTYHNWRNPDGDYEDVKGFCNSAPIERVRELDYVLTPGRYVGLPEEEDDFDFKERFGKLKAEFEGQLKEEGRLNALIAQSLKKVRLE